MHDKYYHSLIDNNLNHFAQNLIPLKTIMNQLPFRVLAAL